MARAPPPGPFRGETTLALLSALAVDHPPPVHEGNPAIPPALSELVTRLLSKDPAGRPASARAVAEALQAVEWEADTGRLRGLLLLGPRHNGLAITPDGHYTGNQRVERGIVMVVQKDDGTQEVLEPAEFEEKYGCKNDPARVRLTD